jgi:hypothetical protein
MSASASVASNNKLDNVAKLIGQLEHDAWKAELTTKLVGAGPAAKRCPLNPEIAKAFSKKAISDACVRAGVHEHEHDVNAAVHMFVEQSVDHIVTNCVNHVYASGRKTITRASVLGALEADGVHAVGNVPSYSSTRSKRGGPAAAALGAAAADDIEYVLGGIPNPDEPMPDLCAYNNNGGAAEQPCGF